MLDQLRAVLGERFQFDGLIASGGQGSTYMARRVRTPSGDATADLVAFKVYPPSAEHERIIREIRAAEGLIHPSLATLLEHGLVEVGGNDVRYLVWEFIDGTPLDSQIAAGPLAPRETLAVGRDIAGAVSELWRERIVHRDIKPANIMLRRGGESAVLIDLGVARHLSEASLTASGTTWGTRGYLSPEQCRAERALTCKSDVYSLGVVLAESLLGRHPTNRDQGRLLAADVRSEVLLPAAPASLASVVSDMLSPRPAFRPSPAELVTKMQQLLGTF